MQHPQGLASCRSTWADFVAFLRTIRPHVDALGLSEPVNSDSCPFYYQRCNTRESQECSNRPVVSYRCVYRTFSERDHWWLLIRPILGAAGYEACVSEHFFANRV